MKTYAVDLFDEDVDDDGAPLFHLRGFVMVQAEDLKDAAKRAAKCVSFKVADYDAMLWEKPVPPQKLNQFFPHA